MPAKNIIKTYVSEGIYHIYNRGINKGNIFLDDQDYKIFLSYLKSYLTPKDKTKLLALIGNPSTPYIEKNKALRELTLENFYGRIELLAYCLMPNHFHLLVKQKGEREIVSWMRALMTRYTSYSNRRHNRLGPLLQGDYRGVLVGDDEQFVYLTRYIHRNPLSLKRSDLYGQPSSYLNYLGRLQQEWVKPKMALANFGQKGFSSYQSFVESNGVDLEEKEVNLLKKTAIDY